MKLGKAFYLLEINADIKNMEFSLTTATCGTRVYELIANELRKLEGVVNQHFANIDTRIGIMIRTLPDNTDRKSFVRYTKNDNFLVIDFRVSVEKYSKLYKTEQRWELGLEILHWLEKGLANKNFIKNNPNFNSIEFREYLIKIGNEIGWFLEVPDYTKDLFY